MKKHFNKLMAIITTSILAATMSFSAFAAKTDVYDSVKFTKKLTKTDSTAPTPAETIKFSAVPGAAVAATDTTPEIKAGEGTLTLESVTFSSADNTDDLLTKTVEGSFGTTLPFTEPGIYRYTVTESIDGANPYGISLDTTAKTLDVYVIRGTSGLEISHSVLSNSTAAPVLSADKQSADYNENAKIAGFVNNYATYDLTLEKQVTGGMGEMARDFDFTIDLAGGPKSATITAKKKASATATEEDITVTFGADGKASITNLTLKDDGTFVIAGLPQSTTYDITENLAASEGYTITATGSAGEHTANANLKVSGDLSDKPETGTEKVTFTNNKDAVTPTGVAMDIAPYALMVVLAGSAAVTFLRKKDQFEE